jgi:hypothetical protein
MGGPASRPARRASHGLKGALEYCGGPPVVLFKLDTQINKLFENTVRLSRQNDCELSVQAKKQKIKRKQMTVEKISFGSTLRGVQLGMKTLVPLGKLFRSYTGIII